MCHAVHLDNARTNGGWCGSGTPFWRQPVEPSACDSPFTLHTPSPSCGAQCTFLESLWRQRVTAFRASLLHRRPDTCLWSLSHMFPRHSIHVVCAVCPHPTSWPQVSRLLPPLLDALSAPSEPVVTSGLGVLAALADCPGQFT